MNAVTIARIPQLAEEHRQARDSWLHEGRTLAAERRDVDWRLGDWLHAGKDAGYLDQTGFDFLSENLGIAPKRLKDITRAVEAFPPSLRDASMSIEHHASAALASEPQLKLEILTRAKREHWTPERTQHEARQARDVEPHGRHVLVDEDAMLESLIHHWNKVPKGVRMAFAERIAESHGEVMEP